MITKLKLYDVANKINFYPRKELAASWDGKIRYKKWPSWDLSGTEDEWHLHQVRCQTKLPKLLSSFVAGTLGSFGSDANGGDRSKSVEAGGRPGGPAGQTSPPLRWRAGQQCCPRRAASASGGAWQLERLMCSWSHFWSGLVPRTNHHGVDRRPRSVQVKPKERGCREW